MVKLLVMMAIATTLIVVLTSCSFFNREAPVLKQKRTPAPVEDCYGLVLNGRDKPEVLGALKGREFWCEGKISKRMAGGVQFNINKLDFEAPSRTQATGRPICGL